MYISIHYFKFKIRMKGKAATSEAGQQKGQITILKKIICLCTGRMPFPCRT